MENVPQHVAIILDGNGRWAKSRGKPRTYGHTMGAKNVEPICRAAWDLGIRYLTFYAFSTENWSRPSEEVSALMKLLESYLKNCISIAKKNNMRVKIIGDKSGLADSFRARIRELEEASKDYTGLTLIVGINYGSRDEIVRAARRMLLDYEAGNLSADELDETRFAGYLDTAGIPDPDLLIRTSGEQRLSNYLMWQLAYAELYFTPVPWPEFDREELEKAIEVYAGRNRRFGRL
ncbi:MAG: isoprenyl transferase [Lachnospiraceae bacterium]|nr:isoprenyl transferase [Lachnospiraceae bacterium]